MTPEQADRLKECYSGALKLYRRAWEEPDQELIQVRIDTLRAMAYIFGVALAGVYWDTY